MERLQSPPPMMGRVGDGGGTVGRNVRRKRPARQRIVSLDSSGAALETPVERSSMVQAADTRDGGGDEYRRRLEALREEAGHGWLRVLSESPDFAEKSKRRQETNTGRV